MATNKWFGKFQPFQLYAILVLTVAFFMVELIISHVTHSLTLLMDSYHMLCNIMALTGCIITMKYGSLSPTDCDTKNLRQTHSQRKPSDVGEELTSNATPCSDKKKIAKASSAQETQLRKLKNTFGWARIDVITLLMCCVFLASLSFSIFVEAMQTLVHIDHQDAMHQPISVLCVGAGGLLLNGLCYLLIGGYTFHQGSFLYVTKSGDVVLSKVVVDQSIQHGERRLSRTRYAHSTATQQKQRQGIWEMLRDVIGCIIVIICSVLILFADKNTAKYIDPALSLVSSAVIMVLSYPYMKESCLILLQTIPDTINIDVLKIELLNHFPDIVNVHDFHIWQLTASKIFSTVHIIFESPKVYCKIKHDVEEFFVENGISHVTIQPEFHNKNRSMESLLNKVATNCLFSCQGEGCKRSHCCPEYSQEQDSFGSKESVTKNTGLKAVKILETPPAVEGCDTKTSTCNNKTADEEIKNQINIVKSENTSTNEGLPSININTLKEDKWNKFDKPNKIENNDKEIKSNISERAVIESNENNDTENIIPSKICDEEKNISNSHEKIENTSHDTLDDDSVAQENKGKI